MDKQHPRETTRLARVAIVLLCIALLPLILLCVAVYALVAVALHVGIWCCWGLKGRSVLFVYSESPIWRDHIEERILPRLGDRAVVLNWSERSHWRWSLAVVAFQFFSGSRFFNPMAMVFRPFRLVKRFRFYEPFQALKHGKPEAVVAMENELFGSIA